MDCLVWYGFGMIGKVWKWIGKILEEIRRGNWKEIRRRNWKIEGIEGLKVERVERGG